MLNKPLIGIIGGTGTYGQWFKYFFESQELKVLIADHKTKLKPEELAAKCDIVIICVPVRVTIEVIRKIRKFVRHDALLCDFTSIKEEPLYEMMKAKSGVTGMHPLFGPLVSSIKNQTIVFCSGRDNHWTKFLKDLFAKNGARVVFVSAKEHDKQMAMIQALNHFVNFALAKTLQKQRIKERSFYSTPISRLQNLIIGRILGSNAGLYADIEIHNPAFKKVLKDFLKEAEKIGKYVAKKDYQSFVKEFKKTANQMKNFIPIAQTKSREVLALMDAQPAEIKDAARLKRFGKRRAASVVYLGPEGTFSYQAALRIFSNAAKLEGRSAISRIFESVNNKEAEFGIVPAENSSEGIIQETLDNLVKYPLLAVGSYNLTVHHYLLGRTSNLQKIKVIKSHLQAFAQCRDWLSRNFPQAILEAQKSTTEAILSDSAPEVAFIGSKIAAKKYNLKILAKNIEDRKNNITQFYVLAKNPYPELSKQLGAKKTLLLLAVYDRVGVLRDILSVFADRGLNLTKLHSRPSRIEPWDYYFFLEVEGLPENKKLKESLSELRRHCSIVRVLGIA